MKSTTQASSKELFNHAFDCLKLLKQKAISTEEAKAHANLLKQSNNLLKYELDRATAIMKYEGLVIRDIETNEAE